MSHSKPPKSERTAEKALLAHLRRDGYRPTPQRRLLHQMHVPGDLRGAYRAVIERLLRRGSIVKLRGGRLALRERVRGLDRRPVVLGVFASRGRGGEVRPFDPLLPLAIRVPASFRMGAADGQVVRVEVLRRPGAARVAEGKILEQLGRFDTSGMDLEIVARRHALRREFPPQVLRHAEALPSRIGSRAKEGRKRFTRPAPVTIDGETAQDFDDAIAVEERPKGGFRLYVHIADVSHFVQPGDALDEEAELRGTSVYFPGHVCPMLPEKISNDLCSLRPGVDRLVHSAIVDVDSQGEINNVRFADGVIRSAARLTYTQVAALIDGASRVAGIPATVRPMLLAADRLRRVLEEKRGRRGSVDCDLPEPTILLDVAGEMTGIRVEPRNRAHRMIEEFMLLANEAVARYVEQRLGHCVYRVHEAPDGDKLDVLRHFVSGFGLRLRHDGESVSPRDLQQLLAAAAKKPEARLINQVTLRSMKRARYSL
jgi:ribonuclease R